MNLAEELDRAIGDGPEHRPLELRLTAAQRRTPSLGHADCVHGVRSRRHGRHRADVRRFREAWLSRF